MKELQSLSSSNQQSTTTAQCPGSDLLLKLQSAWKMLKLLELKYHKIDDFLFDRPFKELENHEVPFVIASSTGIGGPEDVNYDDIQCLMPRLNPKQKGVAGIYVDNLNLPLKGAGAGPGLPPLHLAAQNLSLGFTEAFLMAGADPNLCCFHDDDDDDIANLPLSSAIEALSCNRFVTDWSVEKSVMKLIYILCLQELREPLETIRILASRTEHLEKLSLRYAEIRQSYECIAQSRSVPHRLEAPFEGVENHEVPFAVSSFTILGGGPEDLNCEDIQCLMPRLNPKQKVWLDRALQTYSGPPAVYAFKSRKGFAATTLLSKLFHPCSNSNFTNDKGRLTLTTKVEKPAFCQLSPTSRTCAYLVSMAKRTLK